MSPVNAFVLPADASDVRAILSAALEYERLFVASYGRVCNRLRDVDPITYDEVLHLLKDHVHLENDIEVALGGTAAYVGSRA